MLTQSRAQPVLIACACSLRVRAHRRHLARYIGIVEGDDGGSSRRSKRRRTVVDYAALDKKMQVVTVPPCSPVLYSCLHTDFLLIRLHLRSCCAESRTPTIYAQEVMQRNCSCTWNIGKLRCVFDGQEEQAAAAATAAAENDTN